ncbi:hypothetical protein BJ742DRAFT_737810 [Cladochytrium replicatum]|nr:hypothetical protein BJ742DRAFT_737810 [Cladochytrium replicatum]
MAKTQSTSATMKPGGSPGFFLGPFGPLAFVPGATCSTNNGSWSMEAAVVQIGLWIACAQSTILLMVFAFIYGENSANAPKTIAVTAVWPHKQVVWSSVRTRSASEAMHCSNLDSGQSI